jgi:hypothetical protein
MGSNRTVADSAVAADKPERRRAESDPKKPPQPVLRKGAVYSQLSPRLRRSCRGIERKISGEV